LEGNTKMGRKETEFEFMVDWLHVIQKVVGSCEHKNKDW
jgi:hypothetical protein